VANAPHGSGNGKVTGVGRSSSLQDRSERFSLELDVATRSRVLSITSQRHRLTSDIASDALSAKVTLVETAPHLLHDVVVGLRLEQGHAPRAIIETSEVAGVGDAAMVTLCPEFPVSHTPAEFIFVVDRSGSMDGSKIAHAREAMQLFLKSLPTGCVFNIVGFGSHHEVLFRDKSRGYEASSVDAAMEHASALAADLGGTDILAALHAVQDLQPVPGHARQVFLLTDGEVSNTDEVIAHVGAMGARTFALGLGCSASRGLVQGVARAGRGSAEFVLGGDRLHTKVIRQLQNAMQPAITDVSIDWGVSGHGDIMVAPKAFPPIFNGEKFTVFAIAPSEGQFSGTIRVRRRLSVVHVIRSLLAWATSPLKLR